MKSQHVTGMVLALAMVGAMVFAMSRYQGLLIKDAQATLIEADSAACTQMRSVAFDHVGAALANEPSAEPDWTAIIARAGESGGAACLACPICKAPFHLNPDPAAWRDTPSDVRLVVCPGPHTGDSGPVFHGAPAEPTWWPGVSAR